MEIEVAEFTRGESSSSAAAESKGKGIEVTRGESSSAASQSNVESNLQINICHLRFVHAITVGTNSNHYKGLYKNIPVALKIIQRNRDTNIVSPERKDKFLREVSLLSKLQHDNIVKFIGFTMKPSLTIVTEFMGGGSLKDHLSRIPSPGTLDVKDALTFALGISRAMEYLHGKGFIHRHLKPSNIFLTEDRKTVKVGDFGLCREEEEGNMSPEVGTFPWMAPEVCMPRLLNIKPHEAGTWRPNYNHKADVYSFSLVLWEMLTNNTPFEGMSDLDMRFFEASMLKFYMQGRIPADIQPLLTSCWASVPDKRPEFSEISEKLEELLRNIPPTVSESPDRRDDIQRMLSIGRRRRLFCDAPITERRTEESLPTTSLPKKIQKSLCCCFASCVEKKDE